MSKSIRRAECGSILKKLEHIDGSHLVFLFRKSVCAGCIIFGTDDKDGLVYLYISRKRQNVFWFQPHIPGLTLLVEEITVLDIYNALPCIQPCECLEVHELEDIQQHLTVTFQFCIQKLYEFILRKQMDTKPLMISGQTVRTYWTKFQRYVQYTKSRK